MSKEESIYKEIILEFLDYVRYKVESDRLTLAEAEDLAHVFQEGLHLVGTIDDFADYYGQSANNVKVVIHRNVWEKPERRVYYPFRAFRKARPSTWKIPHRGG